MKPFGKLLAASFDRDSAAEPSVHGTEDFAHAACSEQLFDAIRSQLRPHAKLRDRAGFHQLACRPVKNLSIGILFEQALHLPPQIRIGILENTAAPFSGPVIEILDPTPAFGVQKPMSGVPLNCICVAIASQLEMAGYPESPGRLAGPNLGRSGQRQGGRTLAPSNPSADNPPSPSGPS